MSTDTTELLKLSIIYHPLITDIEAVAMGGTASFSATEKHQMVQLVSEAVGTALNVYVARCEKCDSPIELVCDDCQ